MKLPMQSSAAAKFVNQANNGDLKPKRKLTSFQLTSKQKMFIDAILSASGLKGYTTLFKVAVEYFKDEYPKSSEYTEYSALIFDAGSSVSINYKKEEDYFFIKEIAAHYDMKIKNALLLILLHYAKHRTSLNLSEFQ